MLDKLLKYEIKATSRTFLPLYGAIIIMSIVNRALMVTDFLIPQVISSIILGVLFVSLFAFTIVILVQRFQRNLLQSEGYLMFTIPVKPNSLILSKMIVFFMWGVLSIICGIISVFILAGNQLELKRILSDLLTVLSRMNIDEYSFALEVIVLLIIEVAIGILMVYASLSIGQVFNKNKTLISFGIFIGIFTLIQIFVSVVVKAFNFFNLEETLMQTGDIKEIQIITLIAILINALIAAALFYVTNYMLTKKLNLE